MKRCERCAGRDGWAIVGLIALALLLPSCVSADGGGGGGSGGSGGGGGACDGDGTVLLELTPQVIVRDDPVEVAVTWQLNAAIVDPWATLSLDDGELEVEIPLSSVPEGPDVTYRGTRLNPFGAGAASGLITVLAQSAREPGCHTEAVASTTAELQ